MSIRFLQPPELVRRLYGEDESFSAGVWIGTWDLQEPIDVGLIGVPLAKAARVYAGVDAAPNALRKALAAFSAYDCERDVDLRRLRVRHIGDVQLFQTDVARSQSQIETAFVDLLDHPVGFLPVVLGGDQSVTYPVMRAFQRVRHRRAGLICLGAGQTLRPVSRRRGDGGESRHVAVTDDAVVRTLIEEGTLVGSDVAQLGLHGFAGSANERHFSRVHKILTLTVGETRRQGIEKSISEALSAVTASTEGVYVTVNLNVVDLSDAPAAPGAQFGGLTATELLEAVYLLGRDHRVRIVDLIGVDPYRDGLGTTVRLGCSAALTLLAGIHARVPA